MNEPATVLPRKYSTGPHGLGDPDDLSLRRVENEVMIPKKMRDIARIEKCVEEVNNFTVCCKDSSFLMVISCRKENSALKGCLEHWYKDPGFIARCKKEYLHERSEYRRTGIKSNQKDRIANLM